MEQVAGLLAGQARQVLLAVAVSVAVPAELAALAAGAAVEPEELVVPIKSQKSNNSSV